MKKRNEISGACPQKNRELYISPEVETVDLHVQDIIAASADYVGVGDPWGDSTETEW